MNDPTEFEQEIRMLIQDLDVKRSRLTQRLAKAKEELVQVQAKKDVIQTALDIYRQQQERPDGEEITLRF